MEDCLFCKIIRSEVPSAKVYEDDTSFAFLDINPINPGHTLLIPKEHYRDLKDTPDEVLRDLAPKIKMLAQVVREGVKADGINIGMNNGAAAGQEISHAHIHIMPRFKNDGHIHWSKRPYEEGEMEAVAEKLRELAPDA